MKRIAGRLLHLPVHSSFPARCLILSVPLIDRPAVCLSEINEEGANEQVNFFLEFCDQD